MRKNVNGIVIEEEEFDPSVWQRAQIKNNSGYINEEYQTTQDFPNIPDYHFRIEDDQAILELQKFSLNNTFLQPVNFDKASNKFHDKLKGLLDGLTIAEQNKSKYSSPIGIERHGFYSLDKDYDDEAGIKQAFSRIQVNEVQDQMKRLSIQDKKPKFIKKPKNGNKMKNESAAPVSSLSKQFKKLTISQEDM